MARRRRRGLSAPQKQDLWERWKRGQSMGEIARVFGKERGSIHCVLLSTGGFKPSTRRRSRLALSLSEREEISRGLAEGQSMRTIASLIQRAPSTVSERSGVITVVRDTEPPQPIGGPGTADFARSAAGWQFTDDCRKLCPRN